MQIKIANVKQLGMKSVFYKSLPDNERQLFMQDFKKSEAWWNSTELKKLVEGLKKFGRDLDKIASHIGTKSAEKIEIKIANIK